MRVIPSKTYTHFQTYSAENRHLKKLESQKYFWRSSKQKSKSCKNFQVSNCFLSQMIVILKSAHFYWDTLYKYMVSSISYFTIGAIHEFVEIVYSFNVRNVTRYFLHINTSTRNIIRFTFRQQIISASNRLDFKYMILYTCILGICTWLYLIHCSHISILKTIDRFQ